VKRLVVGAVEALLRVALHSRFRFINNLAAKVRKSSELSKLFSIFAGRKIEKGLINKHVNEQQRF
jgi:hypothetical protein